MWRKSSGTSISICSRGPLTAQGAIPRLAQHIERVAASYQRALRRPAGYGAGGNGPGNRSDEPVSASGQCLDEKRVLRAISKRGTHGEDVFLYGLRLDDRVGPHGLEHLIMRDQPAGMFDQMLEDRKGFRCQQDARLLPGIAAPPETLVHDIEPEGGEYLHHVLPDHRREP
jgi:hypothetical protein